MIGPSAAAFNPKKPACTVYSFRSLFPLRNLRSNTPLNALPYSEANAPVIKSELDKSCALKIEIPPPVPAAMEK